MRRHWLLTFSQDADHSADLLNDRVLPLFESQEVKLLRMLTDRRKRILRQSGAAQI